MTIVDNPMPRIMARFIEAVEPITGVGNYGTDINMSPSAEYYARLTQMGQPTTNTDITGHEVSVNLSVQTEAFASGPNAPNNVYTLEAAIHQCMIDMGFRRSYGPELMQNADSRISRLVSRYNRTYTGQLLGE